MTECYNHFGVRVFTSEGVRVKCPECGRMFNQTNPHLPIHEKGDEYPYTCTQCERTFTTHDEWQAKAAEHGYQCERCRGLFGRWLSIMAGKATVA